jgi:hypothetical protein
MSSRHSEPTRLASRTVYLRWGFQPYAACLREASERLAEEEDQRSCECRHRTG